MCTKYLAQNTKYSIHEDSVFGKRVYTLDTQVYTRRKGGLRPRVPPLDLSITEQPLPDTLFGYPACTRTLSFSWAIVERWSSRRPFFSGGKERADGFNLEEPEATLRPAGGSP